jgi:hypothetical protein
MSDNDEIKKNINNIESRFNARRIREALLGIDNGWLAEREREISELRKKLS